MADNPGVNCAEICCAGACIACLGAVQNWCYFSACHNLCYRKRRGSGGPLPTIPSGPVTLGQALHSKVNSFMTNFGGFDEDREDDLDKLARADRLKEQRHTQEARNVEAIAGSSHIGITKTDQPTTTVSMSIPPNQAPTLS